MATLAKRATPLQRALLRIVSGAVREAVAAHPTWALTDARLPGSIAKRAVGTLSADRRLALAFAPRGRRQEAVAAFTTTTAAGGVNCVTASEEG